MAALLGRRLRGSALQPTPVGLHFLPRLSHTNAHAHAQRQIEKKKEELYDMISNAERFTFQNSKMMRHLSVQIKPRPDDPKWHRYRIKKWITDVVTVSGVVTLGLAFTGHLRIEARKARKKEEDLRAKNKLEG